MRSFTPKVNAHVTYWTSERRPVPATITAIAADNAPVLRGPRGSSSTWGNGTTGVPARAATDLTPTEVYDWWSD